MFYFCGHCSKEEKQRGSVNNSRVPVRRLVIICLIRYRRINRMYTEP